MARFMLVCVLANRILIIFGLVAGDFNSRRNDPHVGMGIRCDAGLMVGATVFRPVLCGCRHVDFCCWLPIWWII